MANIPTYVYKYMKNVINLRKILYLCNGYCVRWMVGQTNKKRHRMRMRCHVVTPKGFEPSS